MKLLKELLDSVASFEQHETLNPKLWDKNNKLHEEMEHALLRIAREFIDFLNMPSSFDVVDIILTGSSANYNYTQYSDIDLHIIANITEEESAQCNVVDVKEFFRAKKALWSAQHNIKLHDIPVETYVQLEDEKLVAAGVYSLTHDRWIKQPQPLSTKSYQVDEYAIKVKADAIVCEIENVIDNKIDDIDTIKKIKEKVRLMRKGGLEAIGEYSVENLAFKSLRNSKYLEKLDTYQKQMLDRSLSI